MSTKGKTVSIYMHAELAERAKALSNVSGICQMAIEAACDAVERGKSQTLTFDSVITWRVDVRRGSQE